MATRWAAIAGSARCAARCSTAVAPRRLTAAPPAASGHTGNDGGSAMRCDREKTPTRRDRRCEWRRAWESGGGESAPGDLAEPGLVALGGNLPDHRRIDRRL